MNDFDAETVLGWSLAVIAASMALACVRGLFFVCFGV